MVYAAIWLVAIPKIPPIPDRDNLWSIIYFLDWCVNRRRLGLIIRGSHRRFLIDLNVYRGFYNDRPLFNGRVGVGVKPGRYLPIIFPAKRGQLLTYRLHLLGIRSVFRRIGRLKSRV